MYSAPVGWQSYSPHPCAPQCFVAWIAIPVQCVPVAPCPPKQCHEFVVPRELAVDDVTSSKSDIIGGHSDSTLTVEYVVNTGAVAPAVEVKLESPGSTATWNATEVADGYHTMEAFLQATPGTKATLTATEAIARVRWCERICC